MFSLPQENISLILHTILHPIIHYPAQIRTWLFIQCTLLSLGLGDFVEGDVGAGM
ncbi:predicted protein [Sclerotinia sclerotiorum 1980 UF-70]|uniref:Uncharacterized protein n=1 Tax=Sclerotinia sclerotiorum (strain ATCC 18683 / 1980 / Ss-1) TaxID=665079 RepID=A7EXT0_SCLS1|nr:predicted protein [Sclerotinia sclerotiorum 1980 UF-70]EDN94272.1 predicted protein [Sclerotinia sclerotiorum 1980 UF-70]